MDTTKLKSLLREIHATPAPDELPGQDLPIELPDLEELISEGADPQFAVYSSIQTQMLFFATMLGQSGIVDDYQAAVESRLEAYLPGYPPISPVTDSYFYLWALLDLKFGTDGDIIGRIVPEVMIEAGVPAEMQDVCDRLLMSRMGIYETIGDNGDLLVVRELVTDRELLVDAPTGYLGSDGDLRFVRLAPPIVADVEYFTELTTPYVLLNQTADAWVRYLRSVMPDHVVTRDTTRSSLVEDRLAAVFKDDCGVLPWLEFIVQAYHSFEPDVVFLTGIPDDPDSLPQGDGTVPAFLQTGPGNTSVRQSKLPGLTVVPNGSDVTEELAVSLTDAQRRAAADLMPQLNDVFKPEAKGRKRVVLPTDDWEELRYRAASQLTVEFGRGRTRLRNLRSVVDTALRQVDSPAPPATVQQTGDVYRLRIDLKGIKPPVWRRIEIPDCSLAQLHYAVQAAMGWFDGHLHEFVIGHDRYSIPNSFGDDYGLAVTDSTDVMLSDVVHGKGAKFTYTYDFGDCWEHTIKVEAVEPAHPSVTYPRCVKGKRNCPPEDCGGVWGYEELLEILADPQHTEHEERIEWCGRIDPERFSVAECTQMMQSWFAAIEQPQRIAPPKRSLDFDLNTDLFDEDGQYDEDEFEAYSNYLQNKFVESPEFDSLPDGKYGFVDCLLYYGVSYLGVTPATMSVADLNEILFDIIPRKVMIGPEEADMTVIELSAFFRFVHREYSVPGASKLAKALNDKAARRLAKELGRESNFGMAKSFLAAGQAAGYDMTSQDDLDAFVAMHNKGLAHDDTPAAMPGTTPAATPTIRNPRRPGRNEPCHCGSGRKYKKCCLGKDK